MTLTARTDRSLIRPSGHSTRYVLLNLQAPRAAAQAERSPVNLAFVVDRSGSMGRQKMRLAKNAVEAAIARVHDDDRFSIVAYDDQVELVVETTTASREARTNALRRLAEIEARGSTDLAGGWLRGCEQVALHRGDRTVDRCLLLTDGLANVGITDPRALEHHAAELRSRGIATTTFGIGDDFDERLLQSMAVAGGGNLYYIESAVQIADFVTSEVGETLEVVARDVALTAHTPYVTVEPLAPYPHARTGDATLVQLGDLVSEQELSVVLKLTFPRGETGASHEVSFRLVDRDSALGAPSQTITWRYADNAANDRQPRDTAVDRAVAELYAARARHEALGLNRAGAFAEARRALEGVRQRIDGYAGDDPLLLELVAQLQEDATAYEAAMAPSMMKLRFAASSNVMRDRSGDGRAKRRSNT